eukprot:c34231_g1_i1 orf=254-886(-)
MVDLSQHLDCLPNVLSQATILCGYALASLVAVSISWFFSGRSQHLDRMERTLICWWIFTGLTHLILEGYFVFTPDFCKKTTTNFFAEVWKEYSKGDSRYAARDSAVVAVEGITSVIEGPASLLAAHAILTRKPYQYTLQLAVCLGQLYGDIVYFATTWLDGKEYAAGPVYFWFYYVFLNNIWVVIPSLIMLRCWRKITEVFKMIENKKHY